MINSQRNFYFILSFIYLFTTPLWSQLTVNGTSLWVDSATHLRVDGHIVMDKNASLVAKGLLAVSGNIESNGANSHIDSLQLFGDYPGKVNLSNGKINHVFLLKTPSVYTNLRGNSIVVSNLHFVNNDNFVILNDTDIDIANLSNFGEFNYIVTNGKGLVSRNLSLDPVIFPVGSAFSGYHPISITSVTNYGNEYAKVGFVESGNYLDDSQSKDPVWLIENKEPIQLSMHWGDENELHSSMLDLKQLRLKGWNGTDWVSVGFDTLAGNINTGFLKTRVLLSNEFKFYKLESILRVDLSNTVKLKKVELLPSFPNPFSSATSVNFKLSEESVVTVQLFSPSGQLVREFKNRYLGGYHFENLPEDLFPVSGYYSLRFIVGEDVVQTKLLKISY